MSNFRFIEIMSNQIPVSDYLWRLWNVIFFEGEKVLYTEHKTKKVKIWLDGYLVPRPTLNSVWGNDFWIDFGDGKVF